MDAIGFLMIGAGLWIMYAAYKDQHPNAQLTEVVSANAGPSSTTIGTDATAALRAAKSTPGG